jgi:hypothetical protein
MASTGRRIRQNSEFLPDSLNSGESSYLPRALWTNTIRKVRLRPIAGTGKFVYTPFRIQRVFTTPSVNKRFLSQQRIVNARLVGWSMVDLDVNLQFFPPFPLRVHHV